MLARRFRNGLMLVLIAMVASLEAPRLARRPVSAELAAVSSTIGAATSQIATATTQMAANVRGSHLGFDTNVYPGDAAMDAWKRSGAYEWVGYYLPGACHSDASWSGTRARLVKSGWGLAVIYVGQQTWGKSFAAGPATRRVVTYRIYHASKRSKHAKHGRQRRVVRIMKRRSTIPVATTGAGCSASFVDAAQGRIDARDAIGKATREGFAPGTVIFLDVEYMRSVPQRMRDYYRAWTRAVLEDGRYRAGIYAHTNNAATIYDDVSAVYDDAGVDAEPPFWVAGSSGFAPGRLPSDVGHSFASVWQGALDVIRTHNGVRLPVDLSVASVASPSLVE